MLTWAIVYAIKSGVEMSGIFLFAAMILDFAIVASIAGAIATRA